MTSSPELDPRSVQLDYAAEAPRPRTSRNLLLVTSGRVALLGTWFAATMLIARILGPISFGLYTLCQNAIRIVTNCVGDPLDMAVMREAPIHLRAGNRAEALNVIRSAFTLRTGLGVLSILITAAVPWGISWVIFSDFDHRRLALLTAAGILGDLLLRSALGYFQVSERFGPFMAIDVVWQLGRAVAAVALVAIHRLTADTAIILYVIAPYVAFIAATAMLPSDVLSPAPVPHRMRLLDVVHYSKWMVAALVMSAIYERLDLFMLNWFRGPRDVGIYAGAMALAVIPDFLNGSIQTVLAPKIAPAHAAGQFRLLQRQYLMYAVPLGLLSLVAAWGLGGPVIRAFLSARYADSVTAFNILIAGTVFNVVVTPLPEALLNFVAPRKVMVVTFLGLVLVAGGGVIVIPRYGVTGAAMLILSARVVIGTIIAVLADRIARGAPAENVGALPAELPGHL
jgi:O-antigen/teichoic acid export membrane protein